ncbi:MAG: alkaline phosphatase family protein [Candidatus Heimdallarchaeota archaeon]|nr:MAG: alkaline phosphatase family protein [Candidatus Aminicenantes bacterium]UCG02018.1 MAG: alkaline phosphatase family protein [Candidatus Heimdallarchaeota archaeon]
MLVENINSKNPNQKVIVIGLDAATFDIINPLKEKGLLPNISKLIEDGVSGRLLSTLPYTSAPAWNSFATGKNPGKHGIYGFSEYKTNSYEIQIVNSRKRKTKAIWNILSDSGKKVIIMNMPTTYPPENIYGCMVAGLLTPGTESEFTFPEELKKTLLKKFNNYTIEYPYLISVDSSNVEEILRDLSDIEVKRTEIAQYLMNSHKWDLTLVVLVALDRIQHYLWHHMEPCHPKYKKETAELFGNAIPYMYQRMDECIGRLIQALDDKTTVILLSDHGAGPIDNFFPYLNLNNWLLDHGLLHMQDKSSSFKLIESKRNIIRFAKKYTPLWLRNRFKILFPEVRNKLVTLNFHALIDWSQTKAYVREEDYISPGIRINVKNREPEGVVSPGEEYESLRNIIIQKLAQLTHPLTGKKAFNKVYKREDVYKGDYVEDAPDLVVEWSEDALFSKIKQYDSSNMEKMEKIFKPAKEKSGEHRRAGIFIAYGPNIKKGKIVTDAEIIDIAPTILYIMGLPVAREMDGRVLTEIFGSSYLKDNPINFSAFSDYVKDSNTKQIYKKEDIEKIKKRLRNLGYLD